LFKRIDHVEMVPSNLEKTLKFYMEVLGFKLKERMRIPFPPMEEIVFLTLNDTMIEIIAVKGPAPVASAPWQVGFRSMALEVEDMDKTVVYLKTKGIELSGRVFDLGTSKRAEIKDPDGMTIELREWKK
jgi:glyoxylase I family protein